MTCDRGVLHVTHSPATLHRVIVIVLLLLRRIVMSLSSRRPGVDTAELLLQNTPGPGAKYLVFT